MEEVIINRKIVDDKLREEEKSKAPELKFS
ncbi:MAG: hypothetical protein ACJAX4_000121 [Clostridium sp.]|jgi:hypothetical protein